MTLTVRLEPQLQMQLERHCQARRVTKTQVITELLSAHLGVARARAPSAFESAQALGLVGSFASGRQDNAEKRKAYLKDMLRAKRAR